MSLHIAKYFDCALIGHFDFTQISMELAGDLGRFIDSADECVVSMFENSPELKATNTLAEQILDFFKETHTVIMLELSDFPNVEFKYEIDLTPKK